MGQPIGVMFSSIAVMMDIYGINDPEERVEVFEKIQIIDHIRLKHSNNSETIGKRTVQKR